MSLIVNIKRSLILMCSVFLWACQGGDNQTNIELIQDMMQGPQLKTQEGTAEGKMLMRVPPKGTIARGFKPYPYDKFNVAAADSLKSPRASLTADELIYFESAGREKYEIYCGVCHGNTGKGDGPIAGKMVKRPPNLTDSIFSAYSEGRIYNVITNGWGLMGSYSSQITSDNDRWAVVDYVKQLQNTSGKGGD